MNTNTLTKLTVKDAIEALEKSLLSLTVLGYIDETHKAIALEGMAQNVQIRDYALGFADNKQALDLWKEFGAESSSNVALVCVYSSALYNDGQAEAAMQQIERALDIDPTYALAPLLRRVYRAQWPAENLDSMRQQLHPKVKAVIEKIADQPLKGE